VNAALALARWQEALADVGLSLGANPNDLNCARAVLVAHRQHAQGRRRPRRGQQ